MDNNGTPANGEQGVLPVMGATPEPADAAGTKGDKVAEAPKEKESYSKEEYIAALETERSRYGGLDSKYSKDKNSWDTERKALLDERSKALAQIEEAKYSSFIAQVEAEGGDVTVAQKIVARERAAAAKERELSSLESWVKEQQGILNEAGKGKAAYDMLKAHNLPETALEKLTAAKDPIEMENIALKLRLEKTNIDNKETQVLDSNRGRKSVGDISKLPATEALGMLMEQAK